jgi:predicted RNA binding protein YcfA (HicA-like mRNA interferase family)
MNNDAVGRYLKGDWAKLGEALVAQGWRLERRRSHVFAYHPDGEFMTTLSNSGEPRALRNKKKELQRHGARL